MRRAALAVLAWLVVGCTGETVVPDPIEVYRLEVVSGGVAPRSLLLSLDGTEGPVAVLAGGTVLNRVSADAAPRVLLIGPLAGTAVLEVRTATPDMPPSATVLDASAGAADGYRRLGASEVELEWVGVP
jgi:hypothetical protein